VARAANCSLNTRPPPPFGPLTRLDLLIVVSSASALYCPPHSLAFSLISHENQLFTPLVQSGVFPFDARWLR
jgi:hypothetical protein